VEVVLGSSGRVAGDLDKWDPPLHNEAVEVHVKEEDNPQKVDRADVNNTDHGEELVVEVVDSMILLVLEEDMMVNTV
jgi:hypothetical protein